MGRVDKKRKTIIPVETGPSYEVYFQAKLQLVESMMPVYTALVAIEKKSRKTKQIAAALVAHLVADENIGTALRTLFLDWDPGLPQPMKVHGLRAATLLDAALELHCARDTCEKIAPAVLSPDETKKFNAAYQTFDEHFILFQKCWADYDDRTLRVLVDECSLDTVGFVCALHPKRRGQYAVAFQSGIEWASWVALRIEQNRPAPPIRDIVINHRELRETTEYSWADDTKIAIEINDRLGTLVPRLHQLFLDQHLFDGQPSAEPAAALLALRHLCRQVNNESAQSTVFSGLRYDG